MFLCDAKLWTKGKTVQIRGRQSPDRKKERETVFWVRVGCVTLGNRGTNPFWPLFPFCQLEKDSNVILCGNGMAFFRCSRSSDGHFCVAKRQYYSVCKGMQLLIKERHRNLLVFFFFLCSVLATEAFFGKEIMALLN